ncbi:MAG: flagellar filament capping protein FliD [Cellvibrionaceae bacterium]
MDTNFITSLGAGSGIDTKNLVEQLVEIEKAPGQDRIDTKRDKLETQISDFGLLRSALDTFQDAADLLSDEETFYSKGASYSDGTALVPTLLTKEAEAGEYSFVVTSLAQSQSLSTATTYSDTSDNVGKGELVFSFGDPSKDPVTITVDDSNNSLTGLKDAINDADFGAQASIVDTGGGVYKLLITAESGLDNALTITANEDVGSPGLANFETGTMSEDQVAADAAFSVNGLAITRSSNVIDDVIDGLEFTLTEAGGPAMNISIFDDTSGAEEAVRGFVDAFNEFLNIADDLRGFDEEAEEYGSLQRDPVLRSILSQMKTMISSEVPGIEEGFTALTNVGIRTELDGTISIDEDTFSEAFSDNFKLVQELFAPNAESSSDKVVVNGYSNDTVAGSYDVVISQEPAKGMVEGVAPVGTLLADLAAFTPTNGNLTGVAPTIPLDISLAAADEYDFTLDVDGIPYNIDMDAIYGVYASYNDMATAIQGQLDAAGAGADISFNGTQFEIDSRTTGPISNASVTDVGASASQLGLSAGTSTAGTDDYQFRVTVDGVTSGLISLTPAVYADESALAAHIQTQINANVTLQGSGAAVDVAWNGTAFDVTSRNYGSKSDVSFSDVGANAADLGLSGGTATAGQDVVGTVAGEDGFGVGQVLLPKLGTDPYGLKFLVREGATSSTINFSKGFGGEMSALIDEYLSSTGFIANRETTLNSQLDEVDDDQERLDRRIESYTERLQAQFQAMENILASLNSSGSYLDGILDRLPFTQKQN